MTENSTIEPPSKTDRTPIDQRPAIEFIGVVVYVDRHGNHVTGRVVFPHPVGGDLTEAAKAYREGRRVTGRKECPIDYRSKRPNGDSAIRNPQSAISDRAKQQLAAVAIYRTLCCNNPNTPKLDHARRVVKNAKAHGMARISVRSLQLWAQKLETQGEAALRDGYVKPTRKVPTFDPHHARQALMVCAWWTYRIGNAKTIDTRMMAVAVDLIAGTDKTPPYPLADLLATIDSYYSWKCNREHMPFKSFARWAIHDLDVWVSRATQAADYRREIAEGRTERTSLQTVDRPRDLNAQPSVSSTPTRKRGTANFRTRRDIAKLAGDDADPPPPVKSIEEPQTIAESLAAMEDQWRGMLLRAAGRDADPTARQARTEAAATLPRWWDLMPRSITGGIDFHVDQWRRDHPHITDQAADRRRFLMFLPHLRDNRGTESLRLAARIMP